MRVFEYGLLSSPSDWRMSELTDRLIPNLSNEPFDFVLGCVFDELLPWWWSYIKVSYVFHHVLAKKSLSPFAVVTWGGGGSVRWVTNGDKGGRGVQNRPFSRWRHFWMTPIALGSTVCELRLINRLFHTDWKLSDQRGIEPRTFCLLLNHSATGPMLRMELVDDAI